MASAISRVARSGSSTLNIELMTATPAVLMLEAKRVDVVPVLLTPPLQSDYVVRWDAAGAGTPRSAARGAARRIFRLLPLSARAFVTGWYQRLALCTLRNTRAFRRVRP